MQCTSSIVSVLPASLSKELAEALGKLTEAMYGVGFDAPKEKLTDLNAAHDAAESALDLYRQAVGEEAA